jgi:hypothetical protein
MLSGSSQLSNSRLHHLGAWCPSTWLCLWIPQRELTASNLLPVAGNSAPAGIHLEEYEYCVSQIRCLDDTSTHKPTMWKFDPHYPSTRKSICCDNLLLWHSSTYTIRLHIFHPTRLQGGLFVTCDITSTLPKELCDIMSTLSWCEIWTVVTKFLDPFVIPSSCLTACGHFLTGFFPTHLLCPAGFSVKCGCFVTWLLDVCDVLPPARQNVDVLSKILWPASICFHYFPCFFIGFIHYHCGGWSQEVNHASWSHTWFIYNLNRV